MTKSVRSPRTVQRKTQHSATPHRDAGCHTVSTLSVRQGALHLRQRRGGVAAPTTDRRRRQRRHVERRRTSSENTRGTAVSTKVRSAQNWFNRIAGLGQGGRGLTSKAEDVVAGRQVSRNLQHVQHTLDRRARDTLATATPAVSHGRGSRASACFACSGWRTA